MSGGVLFVMPTWATPSELWLQRMLEALRGDLAAVACYRPGESMWGGVCPTIDLIDHDRAPGVLAAAIESFRPRGVLVHYLPFALRLAAALREVDANVLVHAHGYDVTWDGRRPEPPHDKRFDSDYPGNVRAMSRWAKLIANSRFTQQRLEAIGVDPSRIVLKPLGVPVPDASSLRRRPPAPPLRVLYLGRLIDFKGPDLTLQAFSLAFERGLDASLTVAGDGPEWRACERLAAELPAADRIRLLGCVDAEMGEKLRLESHVFTAHSRTGPRTRQQEAFGVSFVEAMACGLPVVSGRDGSLPEIVGHREHGLLFDPGNVDAHADALLQLADDPALRNRLGEAARAHAATRYAQPIEAEQLRKLFAS